MEIIFNDVSFNYNVGLINEEQVLKNITLSFESGKIYGITGKSGSGKTTLIQLIKGVILPTSGNIVIDKKIVNKSSKFYENKKIGYVPQFSEDYFLEDSVDKELGYIVGNNTYIKLNSLNMVGLSEDYMNKKINELSFSDKRLISIAATLTYAPRILILDEPGLGLDRFNKEKLIKLLKNINNKYKVTIIIVSHDINLLNQIVSEIIILKDGKILSQGSKEDIFKKTSLLNKNNIESPKILDFINFVQKEKNIKLGSYDDVRDLIKAVYRNV